MYSTSFKTPENLAVFDKWYVAYLVYLDGRWLLTRGGCTWGFFLHSQLSLRRTPLGQVLCVHLFNREKSIFQKVK